MVAFLTSLPSVSLVRGDFQELAQHRVALFVLIVFRPLAMDQVNREDYERAIGKLCISWAMVEHALDMNVAAIYYTKGGDAIEKRLPHNAKDKIKWFRKAMLRLPALASAAHHAEPFAKDMLNVLARRNWCIHGVGLNILNFQTLPHPIELVRVQRPEMRRTESYQVKLPDIDSTTSDTIPLLLFLCFFQYDPLGITTKRQVENAFSSFGIDVPV